MSQPKLSICIPTYNRATYLATLLTDLEDVVAQIPFEVEIIVSDNASTDNTQEVLAEAQHRLPLLALCQPENLGVIRNISCTMRAGKGTYLVYLADDDRLKPGALVKAVEQLESNPKASALYAPWERFDLVTNEVKSQFYKQDKDVTIARGNYAQLMEHVAKHRIFSEISILRRDAFRALHPMGNDLAFWAFTMPCEYLGYGDLIYSKTPFYSSVSRHFVGDNRSQEGFNDVMTAWDSYRGGVEYMYGLAVQHGGLKNPQRTLRFVQSLPIERMIVALRLRLQSGGDPLDNYALAARLRGCGQIANLPAPMEQIRTAAALYFGCVKLPGTLQANGIALIGDCSEETVNQLDSIASLPVRHAGSPDDIHEADMVLDLGCKDAALVECAKTRALARVRDADLIQKFP